MLSKEGPVFLCQLFAIIEKYHTEENSCYLFSATRETRIPIWLNVPDTVFNEKLKVTLLTCVLYFWYTYQESANHISPDFRFVFSPIIVEHKLSLI